MKLFHFRRQEPDLQNDDKIEGERDLNAINRGVSLQNKITNWLIIGGVCLLAFFLLYKHYAKLYQQHKAEQAPQKDVTRNVALKLPPLAVPEPEPEKPAAPAADKLPPMTAAQAATPGATASAQPPVKSAKELLRERRLEPGLRFKLGQEQPVDAPAIGGDLTAAGTAAPARGVKPAVFTAARAYMLPDPTLMMTKGSVIPCTVQPAIDTTLTGDVTCIVPDEVRGADGKAALLDAGTKCVGKQGGGIAQGQRRVGIIWSRCEVPTPEGQHVLIDLDSAAADDLGRPGIPGTVDNHFWDRFGAAIALSLISDIGPYLVATHQGGGNNNTTVAFPNLASGPQEVMSEVLKTTLNIPPTITAPHAARVLIILRNDLDFRDVYTLEAVK